MTADETELKAGMIKALDGDADAYRSLLRLLAPLLRAYFRRRLNSEDAAEDLVQETLMAIHSKKGTFDRSRPFTAWLFAIARYKLADHFRRSHRLVDIDTLDVELAVPSLEDASLAAIDIDRLLADLTPKQRQAIHATKVEGYSLSEVAIAANISPSDAKMSVYRGLRKMAARVQGKMP